MNSTLSATSRPRVLGWIRSAALLDGDWGTSIAYVLGIGFALAGYSSFWHLMMMLGLTALVATNYVTICRLYPNGGGVYSSVCHRSKTWAVIGALLLAADYVITMALSVLDACHYFDLAHPQFWAISIIIILGVVNWYGPKHFGVLAIIISIITLFVIVVIAVLSAPTALRHAVIEPPTGGLLKNWGIFVGLILSISGIEAISNMTGLMKDPANDSRRAIIAVLTKVVLATVFLGLAMHAVPHLSGYTEDMVRFLAEHYVGRWFGWLTAAALGLLLISAGNTALNGLVSIQFLMAADQELPSSLSRLNRHGMPVVPLAIAVLAPVVILSLTHNILILAHLYAIGVVGAVLINIGSTSTDKSLPLATFTRVLMLISAAILFVVELSIAIEKPRALLFAAIVLAVGLTARAVTRNALPATPGEASTLPKITRKLKGKSKHASYGKHLVAVRGRSDALLRFAIAEAQACQATLLVLRVKEIAVNTLPEKMILVGGDTDLQIEQMCGEAGIDYHYIKIVSNEAGSTIADVAASFGVDRVLLGATRRGMIEAALKGSVIRTVGELLPDDIQLLILRGGANELPVPAGSLN